MNEKVCNPLMKRALRAYLAEEVKVSEFSRVVDPQVVKPQVVDSQATKPESFADELKIANRKYL